MENLKVHNPYDSSLVDVLPYLSEKEALKKLELAKAYFESKSIPPKSERIKILKRFKNLLEENKTSLIEQAVKEGGKPYRDSLVEVERGINGVEVAIETLSHLGGREIPMGINASSESRFAYTFHRPRGVVVAVSAFNHPFNLIIHQVIPAIAVGCPVIVKPASTTPLSCLSIVNYLHEAGVDKDFCQIAIVSNEVAEKLVSSSDIGFFSFIGSSKVGWYLRSKLAAGVECALEHGGVAPLIVDETADLKTCAQSVAKGGYYHAGQVCVSVQRLYLHENIKNQFLEIFLNEIKDLKTGDPLSEQTDVGPLILNKEVDRVEEWVQESIKKGARALIGGERISESLYAPTLMEGVSKDAKLANFEVFGPVVNVHEFSNLDQVIEEANSLNVAFQSSIFTQNIDRALKASQGLNALAVMVNDHTAFRTDWMPFGGYKDSGLGLGGIPYSMEHMCIEKMMVIKSNEITH